MTGFEPATPTTPKWCATKLRYIPWWKWQDSNLRPTRYQRVALPLSHISILPEGSGRYLDRTGVLLDVNELRYRCANRPGGE